MERRWERAAAETDGPVRVVSADWVVPVEGDPIADGAVAIADDGRIAARRPCGGARRGRARSTGCVILPGFVNCHTHLEYAVYAGFGDGLPFSSWIGLHVARKQLLELDEMVAIATDGAAECLRSGVTTVGDCSFSGAAAEAAAATGLRAIVYLEVFGLERSGARPVRRSCASAVEPRALRPCPLGVSPHAPYTCTLELYEACAQLGLPIATHLAESVAERQFLRGRIGRLVVVRGHARPAARGRPGSGCWPTPGCSGRRLMAAHCVDVDEEEIALLAEHGVGVAHCPRSNGILGCGVAPLAELRRGRDPRRDRHRQPRLDAVVRHVRRAADRRSWRRVRASARPDALTPARRSSWRRSAAPACSGSTDEIGSLVPGKRADLAVVSLEDSPSRAC